MQPTVYIVEDDVEVRNSLHYLMKSIKLNTVLYENGPSFLEKYNDNVVGCILLDIRMPGMSGMELLDILYERKNRLPVIVITGYGDVPMAVKAMKLNAADFLLKPFNEQELIEKVQKQITKSTVKEKLLQEKFIPANFCTLTMRERKILDLIAQGKLNKEIASELDIAISTVEYHRARLMRKMQAKNVAQLLQMKIALDEQTSIELGRETIA